MGSELIDRLNPDGSVVGTVERSVMRAENLWHRSSFVCVLRTENLISVGPSTLVVVHRRARWKDVFPHYWDLAFGGVCGAGETWLATARREVAEEAGLTDVDLVPIGDGVHDGPHTRVRARVFAAFTFAPVLPADGEVETIDEIPLGDLEEWVAARSTCPDGLSIVLPLLTGIHPSSNSAD